MTGVSQPSQKSSFSGIRVCQASKAAKPVLWSVSRDCTNETKVQRERAVAFQRKPARPRPSQYPASLSPAPLPSLNPSPRRGYLVKPQPHANGLFGSIQRKDETYEWSDKDDPQLLGHKRNVRDNRSVGGARFRLPLSNGALQKDSNPGDMKRKDVSTELRGEWAMIQAALPDLVASFPQADDPMALDHINALRDRLDALARIHMDQNIMPHTRNIFGN